MLNQSICCLEWHTDTLAKETELDQTGKKDCLIEKCQLILLEKKTLKLYFAKIKILRKIHKKKHIKLHITTWQKQKNSKFTMTNQAGQVQMQYWYLVWIFLLFQGRNCLIKQEN